MILQSEIIILTMIDYLLCTFIGETAARVTFRQRLRILGIIFIVNEAVGLITNAIGMSKLVPIVGIPVALVIASMIRWRDSNLKTIYLSAFALSLVMVSYTVGALLVCIIADYDYTKIILVECFEHNIFLIIVGLLFFYISRIARKLNTPGLGADKKNYIFLTGLPLISIVILVEVLRVSKPLIIVPANVPHIILIILGVIMANGLSYYLYIELGSEYEKELKLNVLQNQNEFLQANAKEVDRYYQDARKIYHDLRKYLMMVSAYIENNNTKEAQSFINELLGLEEGIFQHRVICDNNTVNYILNYAMGQCQEADIKCKCVVTAKLSDVNEKYFCIILKNLLDNAYEASLKETERIVDVNIFENEDARICISIKNKVAESVLDKNPNLLTSKQDKKKHGIGVSNVKDILSELGGTLYFYEEEGYFYAQVVI